ncbi:hypothetical protein [Beijerinckia sp. L45]|uniref:hypothetical protein n=1 Tax=Beijerinckia sp. L45 TaxID=1641855 RepID=UPI00131B5C2A|nr:hypothetical protein [Beijerinckia sp. L45]
MARPSTAKPVKESPPGGRSLPASASSLTLVTGITLGGAAAAARELSAGQLIDVRLSLPKEMSGELIAEFQLTLTEAFRLFLDQKLVVAKAETGGRSPTPRLRRAIANTDKLRTARFTTAQDLFDALAKAEG